MTTDLFTELTGGAAYPGLASAVIWAARAKLAGYIAETQVDPRSALRPLPVHGGSAGRGVLRGCSTVPSCTGGSGGAAQGAGAGGDAAGAT